VSFGLARASGVRSLYASELIDHPQRLIETRGEREAIKVQKNMLSILTVAESVGYALMR
jgi:hypothetical protein